MNKATSISHSNDEKRLENKVLATPAQLIEKWPASDSMSNTVSKTRHNIRQILQGRDDRLLVVVGPCSIHDTDAGLDYAEKLSKLIPTMSNELLIVMRTYLEKPRTTVGWKGLINDPDLDNGFDINRGLAIARKFLRDINLLGVPVGTEFVDLVSPKYLTDLVSWGAIGARTTESQAHRELASGLAAPIGFKNGTGGSTQIAIDAINASSQSHHFLSVNSSGNIAIEETNGNKDCHIVLRGGAHTNYDAASVDDASLKMEKAGLRPNIMIDCSHANCKKIFQRQRYVCRDICSQITDGDSRIMGVMIESHLVEGQQKAVNKDQLMHGQSITDPCLGWDDTVELLDELSHAVTTRRARLNFSKRLSSLNDKSVSMLSEATV